MFKQIGVGLAGFAALSLATAFSRRLFKVLRLRSHRPSLHHILSRNILRSLVKKLQMVVVDSLMVHPSCAAILSSVQLEAFDLAVLIIVRV